MKMFLVLSRGLIEAQKNDHSGISYMNAQTQRLDGLINEVEYSYTALFYYQRGACEGVWVNIHF